MMAQSRSLGNPRARATGRSRQPVLGGKCDDPRPVAVENGAREDENGARALGHDVRECALVVGVPNLGDEQREAEGRPAFSSGQIKLRRTDGWRKIATVLSQHTAVAA